MDANSVQGEGQSYFSLKQENNVLRAIIERTVETLKLEKKSPLVYGHRLETLIKNIEDAYSSVRKC